MIRRHVDPIKLTFKTGETFCVINIDTRLRDNAIRKVVDEKNKEKPEIDPCESTEKYEVEWLFKIYFISAFVKED